MPEQSTSTLGVQHRLRAVVVEDETRFRNLLLEVMEGMGCDAIGATSADEALALIDAHPPEVLVLDLNLPVTDGMTFLEQFRRVHPDTPVLIITGFGDLAAARRAIQLGVTEFLTKPCHLGEIEQAIDRARRHVARITANQPVKESIDGASNNSDADRSLAELERDAILAALRANGGNRSAAATKLGISRRALYNKVVQYKRDGHVF